MTSRLTCDGFDLVQMLLDPCGAIHFFCHSDVARRPKLLRLFAITSLVTAKKGRKIIRGALHAFSRSWLSHPNFTGSGLAPLPSFSRFFFSPVNLVYRTSEASSFRILGRFPSTPSFHVLADVSDYPSILTAWRGSKYFYDLGIGNIPAS